MCQRNRELINDETKEERLERLEKMEEDEDNKVFVKLKEGMMAENGSIDSVEYVTYNYSVRRPELFICMLHFLNSSIRFDLSLKLNWIDLIRMEDGIDSIRSEVQIGSNRSESMH